MKTMFRILGMIAIAVIMAFLFTACEGPIGPEGPQGPAGPQGPEGGISGSFTLSETGVYAFPSAGAGYATQAVHTVTISNAGEYQTGSLIVELSGEDAARFNIVSPSTALIASIPEGGERTFTIRPVNSLAIGTYTATVTVSGFHDNRVSADFDVSFTVDEPVYSISLSQPDTLTFPQTEAGYSPIDAQTITVTNTGNAATGALTVALSGANASSFTRSPTINLPSIPFNGDTQTFTVRPNDWLFPGTYTATVTVSNTANGISENFNVSFTVDPCNVHTYNNNWTITTYPTSFDGANTNGVETETCTGCGEIGTETRTLTLAAFQTYFYGTWRRTEGAVQPYTITINATTFRWETGTSGQFVQHSNITWTPALNTSSGQNGTADVYPVGFTINGERTNSGWGAVIPVGFFMAVSTDLQALRLASDTNASADNRADFTEYYMEESVFTRVAE